MVSYNVYKATSSGAYVEGVCLASDEKPVVGIANGSILFAVDASNGETTRYMYDKSAMAWIEAECPCAGGGSGGSGGDEGGGSGNAEPLIVNLTSGAGTKLADKTFSEIYDAYTSGRTVLFKDSPDAQRTTWIGLSSVDYLKLSDELPASFIILTNPASEAVNGYHDSGAGSEYPTLRSGDGDLG